MKFKFEIAGREYPVKMNPKQEEMFRKTAEKVEKLMEELGNSYSVRDKQDLLAMCTLHLVLNTVVGEEGEKKEREKISERLNSLNQLVEDHSF